MAEYLWHYVGQVAEDILSPQRVQAHHPHFLIPVHGEGLPRAGLPVREAGHLSTLEGRVDQWPDSRVVDLAKCRVTY